MPTSSEPVRILFRLAGGFGLGDVTQFSVVLKHLRKHRPHWVVTVQSPRGCHSALHGLCERSIHFDEHPGEQDSTVDLHLDNVCFDRFSDRPSNKTSRLLKRTFGIDWEEECGAVEVRVGGQAMQRVRRWLNQLPSQPVIVHYQGGTSKNLKDMLEWQAEAILPVIFRAGFTPVILDFNRGSPFVDQKTVFAPQIGPGDIWGNIGTGDAETIAALIRQAVAYVGVDSGPGKIASSTDTPTLLCWTKHSPSRFHDPAANTTHLLPEGWESIDPLDGDQDVISFFCDHYRYRTYSGEHGMVAQASFWLCEQFGLPAEAAAVDFVVPNSLASAALCAAKMRGLAQGRPIKVTVAGRPAESWESVQYWKSLPWVREVRCENICLYQGPERPVNTRGHVLYVSDGVRGGRHYLVPDAILAQGKDASEWMPAVQEELCVSKSTANP